MAEEFQARISGENWWSSIDSTRSVSPLMSSSSSPCSVDAGNYCSTEETSNSVSDSYLGCFDAQKLHKSEPASGSGSLLIDSTLQMMGFSLPSSSTSANWNQPLLELQRDYWNLKSFSSDGTTNQVSTIDTFKPMNQEFNLLDQQSLISSLPDRGFPIGSISCGFPSTLSNLYGPDPEPQPQPQHSLFTNRSVSYSSKANYGTSTNELSPIWSKVSTFLKPSPKAKQQPIGLHFSNKTPFWNASAEALNDIRAGAFASSQSQYQTPTFEEKPSFPSTMLNKVKIEETLDSASMMKKNVCEPALKRPRIETPPPLPTFKVRKEKLGDRVTALQQLVSPFGKTDTASVLHEAIEYIKFLQDQVSVLSTPYMKNETHIQQRQGCDDDMKDSSEEAKQDLRSRGLCLVPISSTFPVATETTADFWTPAFGGALLR